MIPKETVLTGGKHPGTRLELMHGSRSSGYYLGFRGEDGSPYSRETYYMPKTVAEQMLALIRQDSDGMATSYNPANGAG